MVMKSYTIYDNTGKIIQSGTCEESDFHLLIDSFPEKYIIQQKSNPEMDIVDVANRTVVYNIKPPELLNYSQARAISYPSITEQLDMLWYAMDTNQIQKAEPFYTTIKTIKELYPKGTDGYNSSLNHIQLL